MKKILMVIISSLMLVGCNLPGLGASARSNDIVIAGGNTTERQILAEMNKQMIEHYMEDVKVDILSNLGSTILISQAMQRNDANISAGMYTGTSLTGELGQPATTNPKEALEKVIKGYDETFDMTWFPTYGFANTYAFMVRKDYAQKHNIKTVSDLKSLADSITAGIDTGWMDRDGDGYEAFKETYDFDFNRVLPMEIGLVYNAVSLGDVDVVLGYSTDGRIDAYDLVILEDDMELFPPYDASLVVSNDLLETHPQLEPILLKLEGVIDPNTMQRLNRISDENKIEPQIVVTQFLEEYHYFENVKNEPLSTRKQYKDLKGDAS